jgi:hypothetical protein
MLIAAAPSRSTGRATRDLQDQRIARAGKAAGDRNQAETENGQQRSPAHAGGSAQFGVIAITPASAASRHDAGHEGAAAPQPEDPAMFAKLTRAPEFVLTMSFISILAAYLAAASLTA